MPKAPKLSICIPTYNQVQFIRAAVESALTQKFDDFEVVVSDNHSTDGTSDYLRGVSDPRFRLCRPPEHVVLTQNFNFSAEQSRGEYITFLSSDNVLHPDFSRRMAAFLDQSPSAAFAYCAAEMIDGEGRQARLERHIGGTRTRSGKDALKRFLRGQRCTFDALMIRRECYLRSGGLGIPRDGGFLCEVPDWDLDLRLAMTGDVAYLDEILVQFRFWSAPDRDDNSRRLPRYIGDIRRMFDTTVQEIIALYPDLAADALQARKAMAVNCAIGVGELAGLACYDSAVGDILRLHKGPMVQFILWMHRVGATPAFGLWRNAQAQLRHHVKELLYQRLPETSRR